MADLINNTIGENYNHFINGMDLDTSDVFLPKDTYRYSENIRLVCDKGSTSGMIQSVSDKLFLPGSYIYCSNLNDRYTSNFTPTWNNITYTTSGIKLPDDCGSIVGVSDIRNLTIIFTFKPDTDTNITSGTLHIFRLVNNDESYTLKEILNTQLLLNGTHQTINNFSIITRYEGDDNIKVYWADGYNLIRVINISESYDNKNISTYNLDYFSVSPLVTFNAPIILGTGTGTLKSGKIQYCYQLFDKNGSETELSPCTSLISLFDNTNSEYSTGITGGYINESTGCSVKLQIDLNTDKYSRIKLYSIFYSSNTSLPIITEVADNNITNETSVYFEDQGTVALNTLSIEQLNIIKGVYIIPRVLESKYNYLLAANVTYNDFVMDYDARSYRFAPVKDTNSSDLYFYLKLVSLDPTDTINQIFTYSDLCGTTNNLDSFLATIPITHDCINPYNTINKGVYEFNTNLQVDINNINYNALESAKFSSGLLKQDNRYINNTYVNAGGRGLNVDYEFITSTISIDDTAVSAPTGSSSTDITNFNRTYTNTNQDISLTNVTKKQIDGFHVNTIGGVYANSTITDELNAEFFEIKQAYDYTDYSGITIDYYMKSLQRDEIYRYGCRFYDKHGRKSDVKWIGDIRTPSNEELGYESYINDSLLSFKQDYSDASFVKLVGKPLGIRFQFRNLPSTVFGIDIVRVPRTTQNSTCLAQGVAYKEYSIGSTNTQFVGCSSPTTWSSEYSGKFAYVGGEDVGDLFERADGGITPSTGGPLYNYAAYPKLLKFICPEVSYIDAFHTTIKNTSLFLESSHALFGKEPLSPVDNITTNSVWPMGIAVNDNKTLASSVGYYSHNDSTGSVNFISQNNNNGVAGLTKLKAINYSSQGKWWDGETKTYMDSWDWEGSKSYETNSYSDSGTVIKLYNQCNSGTIVKSLIGNVTGTYQNINTNSSNTKLNVTSIAKSNTVDWDKMESYFNYSANIDSKEVVNVNTFNFITTDYQYEYRNLFQHKHGSEPVKWGFHIAGWHLAPEDSVLFLDVDDYTNKLGSFQYIGNVKQNLCTGDMLTNTSLLNLHDYINGTKGLHNASYDLTPTLAYAITLKQDIDPYGGYSYTARTLSEYESVGYINVSGFNTIKTNQFGGDTYICAFNHAYNRRFYNSTETGLTDELRRGSLGYLRGYINLIIPVETKINLCLTQGLEYTRNHNINTQEAISTIPHIIVQDKPKYIYNQAYSVEPTAIVGVSKNIYDVYNRTIDTRVHYSSAKTNEEVIDSWSTFSALNYLDLDSRYGSINNLKLFKNRLLSFQENAIALLSIKERSLIVDNNSAKLVLGSGDVLDRFDYISTFYGMKPNHINAIGFNDNILSFYDGNRNEILMYDDTIIPVSKLKKVQSYLNTNINNIIYNPSISYDKKYSEFIYNLTPDKSLIYNNILNCFTSFFTINSDTLMYNNSNILTIANNQLYTYRNNSLNNNLLSKLSLIVNDNPVNTKVFDNVEFISDIPTTNMRVQFITDQQRSNIITSSSMRCKESTYYFAIPRMLIDSDFPDRMRGNTIQCDYVFDKSINQFHIPYIKTKYRISRS